MKLIVNAPKKSLNKAFLKQRPLRMLFIGLTAEEIRIVEGRNI